MKENRKQLLSFSKMLFAAVALLLLSAPSWAIPTCPSGLTTAGPNATAETSLGVSGSAVATDSGSFTITGATPDTASGCWEEFVFTSTAAGNLGDLTFVYEFSVISDTSDQVGDFTTDGFSGFAPSVGEVASPGTTTAVADCSNSVSGSGTAEFLYNSCSINGLSNGLIAGDNSWWLYVQTDAKSVTPGTINYIDGGTNTQGDLAPALTAEPASMILFGTGLLLLGAIYRKKLGLGGAAV